MVRQRGREEEREGETAHATRKQLRGKGDRKEKRTRENMLHARAKPKFLGGLTPWPPTL